MRPGNCPSDVLVRPFWIGQESTVLRRRRDPGEGREPLTQNTIDPLIWWAVEFVERFSSDCLTALHWYHDNRARIDPNCTTGHDPDAAVAWLRSLPSHPRKEDGRDLRDMAYLTAISPGLPGRSIWKRLDRLRKQGGIGLPPRRRRDPQTAPGRRQRTDQQPGLVATGVAPRGKFGGPRRASVFWTVLLGACAVVIGYLGAGPRPLELRTLTRGCLKVRHLEGGAVRYLIEGRIRKGRRDEEDDQQSLDGVEHVWPVLPQAARAVEVLESLPDPSRSDYLFTDPAGRCLDGSPLNKAIRTFIDFANDLARVHHLPTIAADPDGVSAGRLRRTIGPFIRNRPDGAFGLAVVYGHAGSLIGAHYGGMK